MQFNSFEYILAFLPLCIIGYFFANWFSNIAARILLIIASLFFYAQAGYSGLLWFGGSIIANNGIACLLKRWKKKTVLWIGIALNILLLLYFKYTNFAIQIINDIRQNEAIESINILLPLGISFFTFQQISYLVDTFRGETEGNSLLDYLLYITFFPKLLMGPITKQADLISQFHDSTKWKPQSLNLIKGIQMFIIGLFKKVIMADTFALAVAWGWGGDLQRLSSMDTFLVMLAYTFQIYFDFSGYSDMAIGSALMLNIELPMNFDSPYKALSIRDFWKRWHISLTKLLTEYIYIPLGGNRKGIVRLCVNTMIVFLLSGLWHGANWTFILWGALHGLISLIDRFTESKQREVHPALKWMGTFLVVSILWLLFRADSIEQWLQALGNMFSFKNMEISGGLISSFVLPEIKILNTLFPISFLNEQITGLWMILFFAVAIITCLGFENAYRRKYSKRIVSAIGYAVLLIYIFTTFGSVSVFVYNNF